MKSSNLPDVSDALDEWSDKVAFSTIIKNLSQGDLVETISYPIKFWGTLEPLPARELLIKPEGQRTWSWWKLWTDQELKLDDMIVDEAGTKFRILSQQNWGSYFEYQMREGPTP